MDNHLKQLQWTKILQTQRKLREHRFACEVFETGKECLDYIRNYLKDGMSVSVGGSMTLFEMGVIDMLEHHPDIRYLDRYHSEDPYQIFHEALDCDLYLTSSNALTMTGQLVNRDGNGNRVAAMIYGPKEVFVICGVNKIVKDLESAEQRIDTVAAPANCIRLNKKDNPCTKTGVCVNCALDSRICSVSTVLHRSHEKNRIHVLIVNEDLGY